MGLGLAVGLGLGVGLGSTMNIDIRSNQGLRHETVGIIFFPFWSILDVTLFSKNLPNMRVDGYPCYPLLVERNIKIELVK